MIEDRVIKIKYFHTLLNIFLCLNSGMGQPHKKYYICKFSFNRNKDSEDR